MMAPGCRNNRRSDFPCPAMRWSIIPPTSDPRPRGPNAVVDTSTHSMAQAKTSQPHLSVIELGPDVKSLLEEISKGLERNWDQAREDLQFVTSYEGIRELMLRLVDHRQVSPLRLYSS